MNAKVECLILLFVFVTSTFLLSPPVKAENNKQIFVDVIGVEDVYLRGGTLSFTVYTNAREFTLQIYLPSGALWLNKTYEANTTLNFPIPNNAPFGIYTLKALASKNSVTMHFTVLDLSNWQPVIFPYTRIWKGVNYTFTSDGTVYITGKTGNFTLKFGALISLIKKHGLTVEAWRNKMNFRAHFYKTALKIDVNIVFSFVYKGCKFSVEGELPTPLQFTFNLSKAKGNLKQFCDAVRTGNLVFDWSDLRRAKHKFSYDPEKKLLTVEVPKEFILDPYIFEDGFESGDFSAWYQVKTSTGETAEVITTDPYDGSYHAHFAWNGSSQGEYAYVAKDLGAHYTQIYCRFYIKFKTSLPDANGRYLNVFRYRDWQDFVDRVSLSIYNDNGVVKWKLTGTNATATYGSTVSLDTWYCCEVGAKFASGGNGWYKLWVDGELDISITGLTNDEVASYIKVGCVDTGWAGAWSGECYVDCVVVNSSYIGPLGGNTITLSLQARDVDGANLPFPVTFKGTLGNGSSFEVTSNSNGFKNLTTTSGNHTINVWWGTHLIGSTTTSITETTSLNINTKIRKVTYGSDYFYASLNNTDLPAAEVLSGVEVKFPSVAATGTVQLKLNLTHWHVQDEPIKVRAGEYEYQRGAEGWSWDATNKIWTFNLHFSTQDVIIYWEESSSPPGGSSGSQPPPPSSTTVPAKPEETSEAPEVPAQPSVPESYVIYKQPFTVDTTMVAVGLIIIALIVYLANYYLSNYGSVSKLWRKRLKASQTRKVRWKRGRK